MAVLPASQGRPRRSPAGVCRLVEADLPHHPERLGDDAAAHLALADAAVDEGDGHFAHAEAALDRAIGELDLEGVAAGADVGQVDGLEHFAAEALEAASEVADGQAEDGARVEAAALAQEPPAEAPVHGASAFDVAAAEDQVGVGSGDFEQLR